MCNQTEAPVDDKASKRKTASALKRKQSGEILAKIKEQQALDTADSDTVFLTFEFQSMLVKCKIFKREMCMI